MPGHRRVRAAAMIRATASRRWPDSVRLGDATVTDSTCGGGYAARARFDTCRFLFAAFRSDLLARQQGAGVAELTQTQAARKVECHARPRCRADAELATPAIWKQRVEERTAESRGRPSPGVHGCAKWKAWPADRGVSALISSNLWMAAVGNSKWCGKFVPDDPKTVRLNRRRDPAPSVARRDQAHARLPPAARSDAGTPVDMPEPRRQPGRDAAPLARARGVPITDRIRGRSAADPGRPQPASNWLCKPRPRDLNATRSGCRRRKATIRAPAWRERVAAGDCSGLYPGGYAASPRADTAEGMDEVTLNRANEPFFTTKGAGAEMGSAVGWWMACVAQSGGAIAN